MDKIQRYVTQALFHSTFGVTLLTITAMILMLGFLISTTHRSAVLDVADDDEQVAGDDLPRSSESICTHSDDPSSLATAGTRVKPSERYAGNRGNLTSLMPPRYVARLTRTCDCQWAEDAEAPRDGAPLKVGQTLRVTQEGAALKSGQKVKLLNGLAQLTFACGAKVILQGPGVLEIESAKTAILHSGKLTADVPDDLEGFKIRTAVVEVVALAVDPKETKADQHARIEAPAKGSPSSNLKPPAPAPRQSTPPAPRPSRTSAT
jgi:hypothetical protein